jgi:hypothetical protein
MSLYEYWIGQNVDVAQAWRDYEAGEGYEHKFYERPCHLLEIEFDISAGHPIFPFEAIFKTTKRYFHDLKKASLTAPEYDLAAPLYFYGVERGSARWQWLGELHLLLPFATQLVLSATQLFLHFHETRGEKVKGQMLDNQTKKLAILEAIQRVAEKFPNVDPQDVMAFNHAETTPEMNAAVEKMLGKEIKRISISKEPVKPGLPLPTELIDMSIIDISKELDDES